MNMIFTLSLNNLKKLPDAPGIYLFYGTQKKLLYVGKATSLRSRVHSYFSGKKTPRPIEEMIHEVRRIGYIPADSVLEAIILESIYIKKYTPPYNVIGKDDKSWNYIVITRDQYPRVKSMRSHELKQMMPNARAKEFLHVFGPYPALNTKATLSLLRKLFGFCACKPGQKSCLYFQMGQCPGVFNGSISATAHRRTIIAPLVLFLKGKKQTVVRNLEKQMNHAAKQRKFEEATRLRNQLARLTRIQDVALINTGFFQEPDMEFAANVPNHTRNHQKTIRIEGYDISNFGETGKVGSMVVFVDGAPDKTQYRKFKIKTVVGQSDVACLEEVLERRISHPEWPYPSLFLVDGGKPQVNRAKKVLASVGLQIPVVGIAKGPTRKKNEFILGSSKKFLAEFVARNERTLIRVRDEAHRFAISYQKKLRRIKK